MDTIKVMEWAIVGLFTFAGAYYGSSVADHMARQHAEEERQARRLVLCAALRHELGLFSDQVQPYRVEKAIYEPPIRLTSLPALLDGTTLEFRTDHELIGSLLNLQASAANYSDYVQTVNLVQDVATLSDDAHKQMYDAVCLRRQQLSAARTEVLRLLPTGEAAELAPSPGSRVLAALRLLAPVVVLALVLGAFWVGRVSGGSSKATTSPALPTMTQTTPAPPGSAAIGLGAGPRPAAGRATTGRPRPRPPSGAQR